MKKKTIAPPTPSVIKVKNLWKSFKERKRKAGFGAATAALFSRKYETKHALKNASIPIVTMAALQFMVLFSGTVIIEFIFAWPGIGWLAVDAARNRDFPVVQACALMTSILFIAINLVVDILYAYIDPRIRYQ